jgi:ligand-binding sensor domain-containing protein
VCLFVAVNQNNALAQDASWTPVYENFTTKDGLPSMEVYYSYQDSQGYMWFATDRGVAKYNGDKFVTYTVKDGLTSNTVFKIEEDDIGRIWFLSDSPRLCYIENGKIEQYEFNHVIDSEFGIDGYVTSYTAWNFDNDQVLFSTYLLGSIKIDVNGVLTKPHLNYQSKSDSSRMTFFQLDGVILNGPPNLKNQNGILSLYSEKGRVLSKTMGSSYLPKTGEIDLKNSYIASGTSILIIGNNSEKLYDFEDNVYCVSVIDNHLWIGFGGEGGVRRYKIEGNSLIKVDQLFEGEIVTNIFRSNTNDYWFSTYNNGVLRIRDMKIHSLIGGTYTKESVFYLAKRGTDLLFSNSDGGMCFINQFTGKVRLNYRPRNKFRPKIIVDIHTQEVFLSSHTSIKNIENFGSTWVRNLSDSKLNKLKKDTYFGTHDIVNSEYGHITAGGFGLWFDSLNKFLPIKNGVQNLELEDKDHLWFSNYRKLQSINLKTWVVSKPKNKLLHQRINSIHKNNGITFFGTHGDGVVIKKGNEVTRLQTKFGEIQDFVTNIISTEKGPVWMMNHKIVSKMRQTVSGKFGIENFDLIDLDCEKINVIHPDDNYLYVGTNSGIRRIESAGAILKKKLPQLYLGSIKIGDSIIDSDNFKLRHNQGDLFIEFDAVSYENEPVVFRYRANEDEEWIQIRERFIRLNAFRDGDYHLEIQASIDGVNWTKSEYVDFEVLPPFWNTWWFIFIEVLLGAGLVFLAVRQRLKVVDKKHALEQKMIELQQEALTQQMNPHFIFNALGSVQNSILKGDSIQANKYLVKFSRLLRTGLNASRSRLIALEDDKELMENYLAVEKTRLGEGFSFSVEIRSNSEAYSLYISPFLLQPFLENSIKHGIGEDHVAGNVTVVYEQHLHFITCTIVDNGKGRLASNKIHQAGHTSHGTAIAFERIELFNRSNGSASKHEIVDLYDKEGLPIGTKVIFNVPTIRK